MITEGTSDILYHMTDKDSAAKILKSGNFILLPSFIGPEKEYQEKNKIYYMSLARNKSSSYFGLFPGAPVLFVFDARKLQNNYRIKPIDFFSSDYDHDLSISSERASGYSEMEDRLISPTNHLNVKKYVTSIHTILPPKEKFSMAYSFMIWKYGKKMGIPVYFYENYKKMIAGRNPVPFDYRKYSKILKDNPIVTKTFRVLKPYRELLLAKNYNQLSDEAKNILKDLKNNPTAIDNIENFIRKFYKTNPSEIKKFFDLLLKNRFKSLDEYLEFVLLRFEDQIN
jgi:hypothetical protein